MITPWFLNARISAMTVTLLALLVAVSLPLLALWGGSFGYLYIAIGGIVFGVLDCVDGNIARVTGTEGPLGQYADFIADVIFRIVFYVSIALIVSHAPWSPAWIADYSLAIAAVSAWFAVAARLSRIYVENRLGSGNPYAKPESDEGTPAMTTGSYVFAFFSGIDSLIAPIVLVAGYFGGLSWLLIWLFVYSLGDFILTQYTVVRNLRT